MKRFFLFFIASILFVSLAFGLPGPTKIRLVWDANTEGDLSGYYVYYRSELETYVDAKRIDVGNVTSYDISEQGVVPVGSYVSLTAYDTSDNESEFSDEVYYDFFDLVVPQKPGGAKLEKY
jgi:hypothetical protein